NWSVELDCSWEESYCRVPTESMVGAVALSIGEERLYPTREGSRSWRIFGRGVRRDAGLNRLTKGVKIVGGRQRDFKQPLKQLLRGGVFRDQLATRETNA